MSNENDDITSEVEATVGAAIEGEHIPRADADAKVEAPSDDEKETVLIYAVLRLVFDKVAPAWEVADAEIFPIAGATLAVVKKYFPNIRVGPEGLLIAAVASVVLTHYDKPRHYPPKEVTPTDDATAG